MLHRSFPAVATSVFFTLLIAAFPGNSAVAQDRYAIDEREFALQVRWLDLDAEQRAVARSLFDDYRAWSSQDLSPRVRQNGFVLPWEGHYDEWRREHGAEHDALMAEVEARHREYFEDLESILREEQRPRMARVRLGRERFHWRVGREQLPGANVDLIELVEGLPTGELKRRHASRARRARLLRREEDAARPFEPEALPLEERGLELDDEEQRRVNAIIAEFEPRFVDALRAASEATTQMLRRNHKTTPIHHRLLELEAEYPALADPRRPEDVPPPIVDEYTGLLKEYTKLKESATTIGTSPRRHLLRLNTTFLRSLLDALSDERADLLRSRFLELAYPEVYPDPASAGALYDAVERWGPDGLSPEARASIRAFRESFQRKHRALSEEMQESVMQRRDMGRYRDYERSRAAASEALNDLLALGLEREQLNAEQIHVIRAVLTPEQASRLPEWDFEENPRPRPWDFNNETRRRESREQNDDDDDNR